MCMFPSYGVHFVSTIDILLEYANVYAHLSALKCAFEFAIAYEHLNAVMPIYAFECANVCVHLRALMSGYI